MNEVPSRRGFVLDPNSAGPGQPDWVPAHSLERRRLQCYLALLVADIAMLVAGFALAGYFYLGSVIGSDALLVAQLILPVFLTIALYNGAYSMDALIRPYFGMLRAAVALVLSFAAVVFIAFYTKSSSEFSRVSFTFGLAFALFALLWCRLQLRDFVRWRCGDTVVNELLIDDGGPALDLPDVACLAVGPAGLRPDPADPRALDRIGMVLRNIDRVIVSCPPERRAVWAMILKSANIIGEVVDEDVELLGAQGARHAGGNGLLLVSVGPLGLRARVIKRLFDLGLASLALAALAPVMLAVAVAIWIEDGRPILFAQPRVGRGNRFFTMLKFRSMTAAQADRHGDASTGRDDDRITRVGEFIRRTSIDELPQLINVLRGDMSLVGPRPHAIGSLAGDKYFWEVDDRYWQRHALKPGLTGLAQIRGWRGTTEHESDLAGRLNADLEYLSGWSLWRDCRILFATLRVVVHERAY